MCMLMEKKKLFSAASKSADDLITNMIFFDILDQPLQILLLQVFYILLLAITFLSVMAACLTANDID